MTSNLKAHVIIPTHSSHDTLRFAVLSALDQTLTPHRITIIGDGPTEKVQLLSEVLSEEFSIVEFQNKPKLANKGEKYRDQVIKASDADFISYLSDDHLFLPNHLEQMSQHLENFDFVHPWPTKVNPDGTFFFLPSGIEIPTIRRWHRLNPPQNTISLTGASHTVSSYSLLESGWDAGPPEHWTDLYMWVKFFSNPKISTFTSFQTTTINIMDANNNRKNRGDIIQYWYNISRQPDQLKDFQNQIETKLKETFFKNSLELAQLTAVTAERDALTAERDAVTAERDALTAERDHILSSNSWKITKPLRKLGSIFRTCSR